MQELDLTKINMTTKQNARDFLMKYKGFLPFQIKDNTEKIIQDHSKHVLSSVISFLEANDKKSVRGIIDELKGKL